MAQGKSRVGVVRAETGELVFESREQGTNLSTSITVTRGIASTMRKHYDGFRGQCLAQDISFSNIPIDSLCIRVAIEGKKPYFFILCYTGRRNGQKHREVMGHNSERTWLNPRCVPCLTWQSYIAWDLHTGSSE